MRTCRLKFRTRAHARAVLTGFATIGAVIALGALLAHIGLLDVPAQRLLSRLAFYVASPALMVTVVGDSDVDGVLSAGLVVAALSVAVCVALYVLVARFVWRRALAETVIGALCAAYVNAGNLGLPIAAYVLGDAALVAPVLLLQLVLLQPLALAIMDSASRDVDATAKRFSWRQALLRPVTNPLTIASVLGLVLALGGWELPPAIYDPLALVGGMAVPSMLLAYGVSLRLGPRPGEGASGWEIATITVLKLIVQPAVAYLAARFVFGLSDTALLAATVLAALPTAQNIFVHAVRYGRAEVVARDSIFVTTVLSIPVIFVLGLVLS